MDEVDAVDPGGDGGAKCPVVGCVRLWGLVVYSFVSPFSIFAHEQSLRYRNSPTLRLSRSSQDLQHLTMCDYTQACSPPRLRLLSNLGSENTLVATSAARATSLCAVETMRYRTRYAGPLSPTLDICVFGTAGGRVRSCSLQDTETLLSPRRSL